MSVGLWIAAGFMFTLWLLAKLETTITTSRQEHSEMSSQPFKKGKMRAMNKRWVGRVGQKKRKHYN